MLETAVIETLAIENSINRNRPLVSMVVAGASRLAVGLLQEAVGHRYLGL